MKCATIQVKPSLISDQIEFVISGVAVEVMGALDGGGVWGAAGTG